MKWSTSNIKSPNYSQNHEIYVGTHTGTFKKLTPAYEENPFSQRNLHDISKLNKDSCITALSFGNEERSEIWIGRGSRTAEFHSLRTEQVERTVDLEGAPIVGLARYEDQLIAGFGTGQVQRYSLDQAEIATKETLISAGDQIAHLRQCPTQRNFVATGGNGRQNNLKVYDMAAGCKQVFSSKNLPNDYLELEVPVWDSDVGFMDVPHLLATCSRHGYVRFYDTRKQRRPVQVFATEAQMSFATLAAHGNYIYTGTTMGALKAFDVRKMKTFVHTYKGFTGGITDVHLDPSGKFLVSACLDRYVRVHDVDSCVLLYQCYVKSKAMRVLMRQSMEDVNKSTENEEEEVEQTVDLESTKQKDEGPAKSVDKEYEDIFENMQTIGESEEEEERELRASTMSKRKSSTISGRTNKKKKN